MLQRARQYAFVPLAAVVAAIVAPEAASAADRDRKFFESVEGQWSGPGEIVAGKYKGTKFVCNFEGSTPEGKVGMTLDGGCRVGMFTQNMTASVVRKSPGEYRGTFMDGAAGKGLDVTGGTVKGKKVVFSLVRNALNGAMLAHLSDENTMNITVSVRVAEDMVPVIGMNLKRTDARSVGSVAVAR